MGDHDFSTGDAGSTHTYPMAAGELRKGSHCMIKGHPVKISEITTSKTGKHGHAKAHIVAIDIFTAKKYEDLCPCSHNMSIPFVKRLELQALTADAVTGEISLLLESGETKDDIFLPSIQVPGGSAPTEEDEKGEKDAIVCVLQACGIEKIVAVKAAEQK